MATKQPKEPGVTPQNFPSVLPPPNFPNANYDFALQAIMEMQKTVGQLTQAVQNLSDQSKDQAIKLDAVRGTISGARVGLWVIGIMVGAAGSVCGFILKMIFDAVVAYVQHPAAH